MGNCLKAVDQEMCFRSIEHDQAMAEKEKLKEVILDSKTKEVDLRSQLYLLQERMDLLMEEVAQATIKELKTKVESWKSRYIEMADHAEARVQATREEAIFWKDRYVKLAWLTNQAIIDILRNLLATKGMINLLETLAKISQFLKLCRRFLASLWHDFVLSSIKVNKMNARFY
ncbi:hypothetical protein CR513_08207, partial [Mucuna pruriens]